MIPELQRAVTGRGGLGFGLLAVLAVAACTTPQQRAAEKDDNLAAAGFVIRPANTPERQAMLRHLPPNRIVQRAHDDTVSFVYADPLVCNCLYIGTQQAYDAYRRYIQQKQLADEQQVTAQTWSNVGWEWGPWGP